MAAAIVPFPLFLIAIFNPPKSFSQYQLFAWYLVNAVVIRTFLTLFTVPHLALGAELSTDYDERTSVATYRNLMGYVGGLSIQVIAWLSRLFVHHFDKKRGVVLLICCMALIGPMPVMAHLDGLTPPSGSAGLLAVVCFFIVLHQSFFIANINIAGGMVPDIADELALSSGRRQEGIINSGMMLAQKMTFGSGAFFAGLAIDFAGSSWRHAGCMLNLTTA